MSISCEYALVQRPRFRQLRSLDHHCRSPEGAGGSERLGIDRRTERLAHHVVSPGPHPGWGFGSCEPHALELVNEQDQLGGIGGDETLLIALPQRHDGWGSLCRGSLKERDTMATTEEDGEQTDGPTHGHLSVECEYSYTVRERGKEKRGVEWLVFIEVVSFDWNCPKHITPRYSAEEVEEVAGPLKRRIAELEAKLQVVNT